MAKPTLTKSAQLRKIEGQAKELLTLILCARRINETEFEINSPEAGMVYRVDIDKWVCGCRGFFYRQKCKHLDAVRLMLSLMKQWNPPKGKPS